jgi:hypothetical protein
MALLQLHAYHIFGAVVLLLLALAPLIWNRLAAGSQMAGPLRVVERLGLKGRASSGVDQVNMTAQGTLNETPVRVRVEFYESTHKGSIVPGVGHQMDRVNRYEVFAQLPPAARVETLATAVESVRKRRTDFPREIGTSQFVHESGWVGFRRESVTPYRGSAWLESVILSVVEIAQTVER